jgi:hypothetical protein
LYFGRTGPATADMSATYTEVPGRRGEIVTSLEAMRRAFLRHLKQLVTIYLVNGRSCTGILDHVTWEGIYLVPVVTPALGMGNGKGFGIWTAERGENDRVNAAEAFGPALFFPFAVITSFIAGTALGAAASKPPYPPYPPYPYPPYPGPYPYSGPYPYQRFYW